MNVTGVQLDREFEQIVDRADHRRPAGEVPQAFDVILTGQRILAALARRHFLIAGKLVQGGRDVLERRHHDGDLATQHELSRPRGRGLAGIGDGEASLLIGGAKREDHRLAEEPPRKMLRQRLSGHQVGQRDARQLKEPGGLVGEVVGRQVGRLPQFRRALALTVSLPGALRIRCIEPRQQTLEEHCQHRTIHRPHPGPRITR